MPNQLPQPGPERWKCGDFYRYEMPKSSRDHWEECYQATQKHDRGMCDAWRDEVDKLLIFAGLFSAAVTAFTVESYRWLQEDSNALNARLLYQISLQLSVNGQNSTASAPSGSLPEVFTVSPSAVRINVFWFLSLTLSLSTVLIGITCLQWLREYQREVVLSTKETLALRQMRYEGLLSWKVPQILATLPLMLQLALVLFLVGLLELLWTQHPVVAWVATLAVGVTLLFLLVTTVLPIIQRLTIRDFATPQCAYKSPQSWAFFWLVWHAIVKSIQILPFEFVMFSDRLLRLKFRSGDLSEWAQYDLEWRHNRRMSEAPTHMDADIVNGLTYVNKYFFRSEAFTYALHGCCLELGLDVGTIARIACHSTAQEHLDRLNQDSLSSGSYRCDITTAFLFHRKLRELPHLSVYYLESVIRIWNTQETHDTTWMCLYPRTAVPPDIATQYLMCLKSMLASDSIRNSHDADKLWSFVAGVLHPSHVSGNREQPLRVVSSLFSECERWVERPESLLTMWPVSSCAHGLILIFRTNPHLTRLEDVLNLHALTSLVSSLNRIIDQNGGASATLNPWQASSWQSLVQNTPVLKTLLTAAE